MPKRWIVAAEASKDWLAQFPDMHPKITQLLFNRGLETRQAMDEFLNPDYSKDVHDPFLFRDMRQAVDRLRLAREKGEKITVHGDYDADGVSAATILFTTLKALGAKVDVYLPHREKEGYGLNIKTIEYLAKEGTNILITCDCGISNAKEIARAKELGMETIITDHHTVPENMPPALAILHPLVAGETYPFRWLTGGGVAFKLAQALVFEDKKTEKKLFDGFEKWLLDCVAISTVADFGPLKGENRTLVKYGLVVLGKTKRVGLKKIFEIAGLDVENITTQTIGWKIAPRINAAGRLDHASTALALMTAEDTLEAALLAESLNKTNTERQGLTERIVDEAKRMVGDLTDRAIVVLGERWPAGVVGLVAGRLSNVYSRPTFVMTETEEGKIVGSGRTSSDFHLTECLRGAEEYLAHFGGHAGAAGFTLKSRAVFEDFKKKICELASVGVADKDLIPAISIDAEIILDEVSWDFIDTLNKFEPVGYHNPMPLFVARGLRVETAEGIGKNAKHLRLAVRHKGMKTFKMIGFFLADASKGGEDWSKALVPGDVFDAVIEVGVNEWNGRREMQFKVVDLKKSE